ncbi:MAG: O-antigen ligase domain-containing protein [Tannerella sp.]|nr:O-antigen ligase domain-containing protein [Tannerella sp.]
MQETINRQFFNLTLFTLVFGVLFYDAINTTLGFSYIDEICAVLLLLLFGYKVIKSDNWGFNRQFFVVLTVFVFYLIYSIVIQSNSKSAILMDFIIQIKPYMAFYCVYALKPEFNDNQKKIIKQTIIICSCYVLLVGMAYVVQPDVIKLTFVHPSRLATCSSALALLYLYCSNYTRTDKIIFLAILGIGLLSTRSKHFGFFTCCLLMSLFINKSFRFKMNFKNIIYISCAIALTVFVAWDKIYLYFVTGGFGSNREADDMYARMALYFFSWQILFDYIPFGSGFGSYATFASAEFYSPIYAKYGMDSMFGLSKSYPDFITDTYFPVLAQFGFVGAALFFLFWINITVKAIKSFDSDCVKEVVMTLMVVIFFLIECTSDSTLTHNRGMFMMMVLGILMADINKNQNKPKSLEAVDVNDSLSL